MAAENTTQQPEHQMYGVFAIDDVQVALPLSQLREVIPRPRRFERLPAATPCLIGAVNLRHEVVPVLDLRRALDSPGDTPMDIVVVVVHEGHLLGLLASEVRGVLRRDPAALVAPVGQASTLLVADTFEREEDGSVVSVLDGGALRRLPGVPAIRARQASAADDPRLATGHDTRRNLILLDVGSTGLCLDVTHVHSVIPELQVQSSPITGGAVRGVMRLGDDEVPVVDPVMQLKIGGVGDASADRGVALSFDRGLLVFAVTRVLRIVSVPDSQVVPLPVAGVSVTEAVTGILTGEGDRPYLLLDAEALRADPELGTLASLGMPVADARPATQGTDPDVVHEPRTFLSYHAGVDVATPLAQVNEILPYPKDLIPLPGPHGSQGVFTHRGAAIPLLCLPTVLGRPQPQDVTSARVLIVAAGAGHVGFAVTRLQAIEQSVWAEDKEHAAVVAGALRASPLVEISDTGDTRTVPNLDLEAMAALLCLDQPGTAHPTTSSGA